MESAREWAGLVLSSHMARNRSGWSVRISSAIELHGTSPEMIRAPVTGVRRAFPPPPLAGPPPPAIGAKAECRNIAPGLPKLPVKIHTSLSRYDTSVLFGDCCTPRSSYTAADDALPIRRAEVRSRSSGTPHRTA